jgi:structural maintenance of chromosome 1
LVVHALQEYADRLGKLSEGMTNSRKELATLTTQKDSAAEDFKASDRKTREFTADLEVVNEKLRDAGDDRRRSQQEERMSEAIDTMKSVFKGVHGKLVDLCKPIQKKYSQAVSVSAGKQMDAIVVDTKQVATECIRYLKDQRVGTCGECSLVLVFFCLTFHLTFDKYDHSVLAVGQYHLQAGGRAIAHLRQQVQAVQ